MNREIWPFLVKVGFSPVAMLTVDVGPLLQRSGLLWRVLKARDLAGLEITTLEASETGALPPAVKWAEYGSFCTDVARRAIELLSDVWTDLTALKAAREVEEESSVDVDTGDRPTVVPFVCAACGTFSELRAVYSVLGCGHVPDDAAEFEGDCALAELDEMAGHVADHDRRAEIAAEAIQPARLEGGQS